MKLVDASILLEQCAIEVLHVLDIDLVDAVDRLLM